MNRFVYFGALALLLGACNLQTLGPTPDAELDFDICPKALEQPTKERAFQGYEGWFFFDLDLEESYTLLEQAAFMTRLSESLKAQGVTLVLVPVSSRAVVRPDVLYLKEPLQAAFSPRDAEATYTAFVQTLRDAGVTVVDVVAATRAFDASGGQSFFRRDLHWTPEGASVVFGATAAQIRQTFEDTLPVEEVKVTRRAETTGHRGQFVNNWTATNCGYLLPPEPLSLYSVSRPSPGNSNPEVVLTGSSFSGEPYYYDFLADALQSEVLNLSVGAGGAQVGLETYLLDGAYEAHKPQVLVWEFPVYAPPLSEEVQRQLIGSVYGSCTSAPTRADLGSAFSTTLDAKRVTAADTYLQLSFSDLSLLTFDVTLDYRDGFAETLAVNRSSLTLNRGRYFLTLIKRPGSVLRGVNLRVPHRSEGTVDVQLCPLLHGSAR